MAYIVRCPQCNKVNVGSQLHCVQCQASLIGVPREQGESLFPEPASTTISPEEHPEGKTPVQMTPREMENKPIDSKLPLGAYILCMVITQALGLYSIGFPSIYFIEIGNPVLCIFPVSIISLAIASWVFFARKKYKRSTITTGLGFILALLFISMFWGAQLGG